MKVHVRERKTSRRPVDVPRSVEYPSGTLRFSMDELQVEELPVPDQKWFRFQLENPAVPSFATLMKDYFGPEDLVSAFWSKRGGTPPERILCKAVAMSLVEFPRTAWEHRNIWDFDYNMEADSITVEQAILECGSRYELCIRPVFHNLRYYSNIRWEWIPVPDRIWGQTGVVEKSGEDFVTNLFLRQKTFPSYEEVLKEMRNPANIRFDAVCEDIFGDG